MTIQTLSAMLMGYLSPQELSEMERLAGSADAIRKLESLIPDRTTYLLDFF